MLQKRTVVHTNHKCVQKEHLCPKRTFVSGPSRALCWVPTSKCKKEHLCPKITNVSKNNIFSEKKNVSKYICVRKAQSVTRSQD